MFAEIIPITRLPSRIKTFSYSIPENLTGEIKIGQAVEIPFRNKNIIGIVLELKRRLDKKIKLKLINKILDPIPLFNQKQLEFVLWLANFYRQSPGLILKIILPQIPKRKFKIKEEKEIILKSRIELSSPQEKIIKQIEQEKNKNFFLWSLKDQDKYNIYLGLTKEILNRNKQILIIAPEIYDLNQLLALFQRYFNSEVIAFLHGKLAKNRYFNNWQKIRNGQAKIILGTRQAIFAPAQKLGLIIIDKEHDPSHKQWDQNPRYHDHEVALKLVKLTGAKLLFSSHAPTLETFYQIKEGGYKLLESKKEKIVMPELIDMREEVRQKNFSPFSEKLSEAIKETLKNKRQIFLFINRRGQATSVICQDCGFVFKCPNCRLPLVYHSNSSLNFIKGFATSFLKCHHCNFKMELPLFCPGCHGPELKFIGVGTQKIEKEIKKLNFNTKIIRLDSDTEIKKCFEHKNCSIGFEVIIGTQFALKFIDWKKIGLIGIVSADTLLYLPNFRSMERTYQLLSEIIFKLALESPTAKIIIQTCKPENFALQSLVKNDPLLFYDQELKERKDFSYPPFTRLIKLIFQHKNEKKCIYESRHLWRELNKKVKRFKEVKISLPQPVYTTKVRGRYRYQIIIKIPMRNFYLISSKLLTLVSDEWIIDIDPESLL